MSESTFSPRDERNAKESALLSTPRTDSQPPVELWNGEGIEESHEYVKRDFARTLETELRQHELGAIELFRKLDEGTLHVIYCNGNHSKRVGTEGMVCNCTLGQEIKGLRRERDEAKHREMDVRQILDTYVGVEDERDSLRAELGACQSTLTEAKEDLDESERHNVYTLQQSLHAAKTIAEMEGEDPKRYFASMHDRIWFLEMAKQLAESQSREAKLETQLQMCRHETKYANLSAALADRDRFQVQAADLLAALNRLYEGVSLHCSVPDQHYDAVTGAAAAIAKAEGSPKATP